MNRVADAVYDENSVIAISKNTMQSLQFLRGDAVVITENNGRDTVLIVVSNDELEDGYAYINHVVRDNLRVRQGDVITIYPCLDIRYVRF